ncbi:MAG: L-seryl-tRNA(Sec) selenium transferase [Anaerolineales bacterium]|nr:L-seryl-tRNA(Sec) selenium transferase [Anaerolineales bacterium]
MLRNLPSIDRLLTLSEPLLLEFGRPLTTDALRATLDETRTRLQTSGGEAPDPDALIARATHLLHTWTTPTLQPVINATGVIIHTNLGRAPLSRAAIQAMQTAALGYTNLEYDLPKGQRGSRYDHAEDLLKRLTGAEAALVVNNNAAAVMLVLSALAKRRRVLISRTQLVEIGGGFRIPDVMAQSGAKLVEIGATNRVHLRDYETALAEQPIALLLSAHQSNFRILGFHTEPTRAELATLAHAHHLPYVEDLGSGTFLDTALVSGATLTHEPTVQESLAAGVDLVTFSGDKLLGGPQAGIIAGRADLVAKLKKHPLARALRADKLTYAALSATLLHYLKGEAAREIPIWRMISLTPDAIRTRAQTWRDALGTGELISGESTIGGGSLPGETLLTTLLALKVPSPQRFLSTLRKATPPLIARVENDQVVFDPRTVLDEQDENLLHAVKSCLNATPSYHS